MGKVLEKVETKREGEEKSMRRVPFGVWDRTWDLLCAKQMPPAARHIHCLDKKDMDVFGIVLKDNLV